MIERVPTRQLRPLLDEMQPTDDGPWYVVDAVEPVLDEHGAIDPDAGLVVHTDGREWPTLPSTLWRVRPTGATE